MPFAVGIDLGTTTSEAAWVNLEKPVFEPRLFDIGEAGSPVVPSVVWFDEERKPAAIIVGAAALRHELTEARRQVRRKRPV